MISIIIVNWNSADYLKKCLQSIYATMQKEAFEIIIIDNASFDKSKPLVKNEFPDVNFIQSKTNLGFACANNVAYLHASGETLLFLNPDTEIVQNAIQVMMSALYSDETIGIVGCRLLNTDKSLQTSCVQPFPTIFNQIFDAEILKKYPLTSNERRIRILIRNSAGPEDVEVISGACLMIKRNVFEKVGRFSEDYFMYSEDIDLCYKVKSSGYRICYTGKATIIHHGGKSSSGSGQSGFSIVLMRQSIYTFLKKTRGPLYAFTYWLAMLISATIRLLCLLCSILPQVTRRRSMVSIKNSLYKWYKIGRWCLGFEQWVRRLHISQAEAFGSTTCR
jgi:GT2 family glycosyltransferase